MHFSKITKKPLASNNRAWGLKIQFIILRKLSFGWVLNQSGSFQPLETLPMWNFWELSGNLKFAEALAGFFVQKFGC